MFFAITNHINMTDKETTIRVEEESKGFIFFKTFTVKWVMVNKTVEKMLQQNGERLRNGGCGCVLETTYGRLGVTKAQAC